MSEQATCRVEIPEKPRELWLPHPDGTGTSCHKVLALATWGDGTSDGEYSEWGEYMIVQCQGTKRVSFCHRSGDSESLDVDGATGEQIPAVSTRVYPSRISGRPDMQHTYHLPHGVHQVYEETRSALCSGYRILAGIGIRAIMEAVCKEKEAAGRNLENKIDSLVSIGLVTSDGAEILHGLRFLGNKAAHEIKPHTDGELNAAFDIAENLLQSIYVIPKLAARFRKRKKVPDAKKGGKGKKKARGKKA